MFNKVTAVYFSATGTNMRSVCTIAREFCDRMEVVDVTMRGEMKKKLSFGKDDLVVIGAPVYGGRIYQGAMERFSEIHGNGTPCIVTVTYGNRHYDDALLELTDFMKMQGFQIIAAAALVGQHTFGHIQEGRPNGKDMEEDRDFTVRVKEKIASSDWSEPQIPGNYPYREGGKGGKFRPLTNDSCTLCGACVAECPEGAIASDCKTIDPDKCISCFRCIRNCPWRAKNMDVPAYQEFAEAFSQKLSVARENEYFL